VSTQAPPPAAPFAAPPERRALTLKSLAFGLPLLIAWIQLISWALPSDHLNQQQLLLVSGFGAVFTLFVLKYVLDFFGEVWRPNPAEMTFIFALLLAGIPSTIMGRLALESAVANHFLDSVDGGRDGIVPDLWAPNPHLGVALKLDPPDARCPFIYLPDKDDGTPRRAPEAPPADDVCVRRIAAAAQSGAQALQASREAAQHYEQSREVLDTLKEVEEAAQLAQDAEKIAPKAVESAEKAKAELANPGLDPKLRFELQNLTRMPAYLMWAAETSAEAAQRGPGCVVNADAVRGFRKGKESVPWAAWSRPLLYWFLVMAAFLILQLFFMTALREAWIEQERLPFPIARLAEGVLRPDPARSWRGEAQDSFPKLALSAAFFIGLLFAVRGMLTISETTGSAVPPTNSFLDLDLTERNWIPGVSMHLQLIPFALLMMMFFPLDLLFTVIVTFVIAEFGVPFVLDILGVAERLYVRGYLLRTGGMYGITIFTLIFQRKELLRLVTGLWQRASGQAQAAALTSRELSAGFLLALGAFGGLILYGQAHTGVSVFSQGLFLGYVLLLVLVYNLPFMRMRGTGGFEPFEFNHILHQGGWFNWHWWKQVHTVPMAQGSTITYPDQPLNYLSLYQMETFGAYGQSVGPAAKFLDAFALGEATRARARDIFKGLLIGIVAALAIGMPIYLIAAYHVGYDNTPSAGSWSSICLTSDKASRYYTKLNPGFYADTSMWWVVGGALLMGLCMYLRRESSRFPIEPMGLLIAGSDGGRTMLGIDTLWFTFGVAWLLKWVLFRWYGVRFFQEKVMPLVVYILMGMTLGLVLYMFLSAVLLSRGIAF